MFIDLLVWLCFISLQVSFQYQSCNNKYQLGNLVFDSVVTDGSVECCCPCCKQREDFKVHFLAAFLALTREANHCIWKNGSNKYICVKSLNGNRDVLL